MRRFLSTLSNHAWWARFWRAFDTARVFPRAALIFYGLMVWEVTGWFMALPNPTNAQGMFVSVVYGAIPFLLNFYMQNGITWEKRLPPPRTRRDDVDLPPEERNAPWR